MAFLAALFVFRKSETQRFLHHYTPTMSRGLGDFTLQNATNLCHGWALAYFGRPCPLEKVLNLLMPVRVNGRTFVTFNDSHPVNLLGV